MSRKFFPNSAKTSPTQPNSWTISRRRKIHLNNVEKNDLKFWKILLIYYIKTKQKRRQNRQSTCSQPYFCSLSYGRHFYSLKMKPFPKLRTSWTWTLNSKTSEVSEVLDLLVLLNLTDLSNCPTFCSEC